MTDLFTYAARRRDRGMALAADAQDWHAPAWSERAYAAIESIARRQSTVHANDLADFDRPEHPNAWGAVWMKAIKRGLIEHSGQVRACKDARKNLHKSPVYSSRIYRGSAS